MASLIQKIPLMILLLTGFIWLSEGEACTKCTKCPDYWMKVGDYCYQFFGNFLNFHDAENICNRLGGDLPSIRDEEESNTIYQLWKGLVYHPTLEDSAYWIGLHDTRQENNFEWTDGTPVRYYNWQPAQPDNYLHEDCVSISNRGNNDYERQRWNDWQCGNTQSFFCRMPLN